MDKTEIFAKRLKQVRTREKLSLSSLAEKLGNSISKQSISKYESAQMMPNDSVLISLAKALNVSVDYLFTPFSFDVDSCDISFRKKASLGIKDIASLKIKIQDKVENYLEIKEVLGIPTKNILKSSLIDINDVNVAIESAIKVRSYWDLGSDAIANVPVFLENIGINVIWQDAPDDFDGLSGFVNSDHAIIVLNENKSMVERRRFTALHELAHLLFNDSFAKDFSNHDREKFCDMFASEFLLPSSRLLNLFSENRKVSLAELIEVQQAYGISIDAIMIKLRQLKIISEARYKSYCIRKNTDLDMKSNVLKCRFYESIPNRLLTLVYMALTQNLIPITKASSFLEMSVDEIHSTLKLI